MKLENQKQSIVIEEGESNESIGMSLDLDSAQILMQMLSKNLYSDAIGSTVRECASNALDSHRRAGVDDPIIVSLYENSRGDIEFSVEDFGIGLDDDDVRNIISKYGKSTKRNSDTELGMMGLGFKAPLAYSSTFYFVCRKDGMERKYMMYEGEETNTIDLLYEEETSERNGVKVIVPVRYSDRHSFSKKIKQQLSYFESVYFDCNLYGMEIKNDFKIYRGENFQYSELAQDPYMHICLDNVYYPIDFAKLDMNNLAIPIGLKFSLTDGIYPTPNRESIRYTPEAKQTILKKMQEVADYMVEKYNSKMKNCDSFIDVYQHYNNRNNVHLNIIENGNTVVAINISQMTALGTKAIKEPVLSGVKHVNLNKLYKNIEYVLGQYEVKFVLNAGKFREIKNTSYESSVNLNRFNNDNFYYYSNILSGVKKDYFRQKLAYSRNYLFIKKTSSLKLFPKKGDSYSCWYNILGLSSIPKSDWRKTIVEAQNIIQNMFDKFINVDEFEVPKDFIEARKVKRVSRNSSRREKMKGDIIVKEAQVLERYVDGKNCKFVSETWALKDIPKKGKLFIYGEHSESMGVDAIFPACEKQPIQCFTVSKREKAVLEEMEFQNVIHYSEFMKGKNKPFKRLVTSYLIHKLMNDQRYVFAKLDYVIILNRDFGERLKRLKDYERDNYINMSDHTLYKAMYDVAIENNLFDLKYYQEYLEVKSILEEKLYFMNEYLRSMITYYSVPDITKVETRALIDLCKYNKFKLDYQWYKSPEKEEEVVENL